ncbi:MAG: hypothetical protein AB7S69_11525 [Salinivirgaceae bacterium]
MKYLKIEDNKGYFLKDKTNPDEWTEIDQIEKNDLMKLLESASEPDFEMDAYNESLIQHKAHQIIYKNLTEKFDTFLSNKSRFIDESESIYKTALEKYQ